MFVFVLALLWQVPGLPSSRPARASHRLPSSRANRRYFARTLTWSPSTSMSRTSTALWCRIQPGRISDSEEGKPQTIKYFSAESNQPLTLGILIDSSGSMQNMLPEEKIVGSDFLRSVITDKDLAFVLSFDISVDLLQDLTSDVHQLSRGLDKQRSTWAVAAVPGVPGIGQGPIPISHPKGTLLYDGIFLASDEMLSKQVGRKAIVVMTDGVDQGSREKLKDSIEAAQKADTICYVLLISDPRYGSDPHDMSQLAEQTGGRMITVNNPNKLGDAFKPISNELRSQYSIGYTPSDPRHDGSFRKIEIKAKDLKVQARKGYYAPSK